jgi:hypothetical protein
LGLVEAMKVEQEGWPAEPAEARRGRRGVSWGAGGGRGGCQHVGACEEQRQESDEEELGGASSWTVAFGATLFLPSVRAGQVCSVCTPGLNLPVCRGPGRGSVPRLESVHGVA